MAKKKNELEELKKRQDAMLSGGGLTAVKTASVASAADRKNTVQMSTGKAQQQKQAQANENIRAARGTTAQKPAVDVKAPQKQTVQQSQGKAQQQKQAQANASIRATRAAAAAARKSTFAKEPAIKVQPIKTQAEKTALEHFGREWQEARARGDQAGMDAAHAKAEALRSLRGYSGGADGSQNIRVGGQKSGQEAAIRAAFAALGMEDGTYHSRAVDELEKVRQYRESQKTDGVLTDFMRRVAMTADASNINLNAGLMAKQQTDELAALERAVQKARAGEELSYFEKMTIKQAGGRNGQGALAYLYSTDGWENGLEAAEKLLGDKKATALHYGDGSNMAKAAAELNRQAREGAGKGTGVALDIVGTGADMLGRSALSMGNPYAYRALSYITTSGSEAQEAIDNGADVQTAQKLGRGLGAASAAIEGIGGVGASDIAGKAAGAVAGKAAPGVARFLAETPLGRIAANAMSEGFEEFVEEPVSTGIKNKILGTEEKTDWKQAGYNAAIGALMGGLYGSVGEIGRGADARTDVQQQTQETQTIGRENVRPEQVTTRSEQAENTQSQPIVNASESLVGRALRERAERGTIGNRTAEAILADGGAMDALGARVESGITKSQQRAAAKEAVSALANRVSEAEAVQTVEGRNPGTLRQGAWGENEVRPQVRTEEDVRPETPDYEAEQRAQEIAQRQFDAREAQLEAEARAEEIERMGREQLEALESESYRIPDEEREARRDEILREMAEGRLEALESSSFDVDNTDMRAEDAPMGPEDTEQRNELPAEPTALDIARSFDRVWEAERQLDEAEGRIVLSDWDERQVQSAMLNGGNVDWNLCEDPQAAMHIYQMRRAVEEARRPWRDFIAERNDSRAELAARAAEMFDGARDKIGLSYARETMERNLYDIMGKSQQGRANARNLIDAYITPVHERVARGNRLKNELRGRVREMGLSHIESEYTQYLLEGRNDEALNFLNQNSSRIDQDKCRNAADEFRQIYNDLHDRIYEALVNGGYEPAKFRRNYAPHFRETTATTMLGRIAQALGFYTPGVDAIPTDLAGITDTFRPGKKWFGNLLQRETDATAYDAVKGFDMYVETAADVITLTESIRDLNALEDAIRYRFSDQGTRETVDKIRNDRTLNPLEKLRLSEEAYENARMGMGGFVTELRKYSNHLAGKKDRADRGWEDAFGRGVYSMARQVDSRFRANMVGGNLGSAITNFIPLTQAVGEVRADRLAVGMMDTLRARAQNDGFVNCSTFLTNRRGSERLDKTAAQRFGDIIGAPMTIIDNFTAESIVRAAYRQNLAQGDDYNTAMERADAFAARLMADRSKGAVPSALRAQNPAMRALTAFQIEVNNQLSYMAKDLPRELGEEGVARVAAALVEIFVCGWLFNQGYHALTGREAAFEPITLLREIFDIAIDEDEEKDALDKAFSAGGVTLDWMAENTPVIGSFFGGGRVPISSALPDTDKLGSALQALRDGNGKKAAQDFYAGVKNPLFYLVPPAGGGAIKKAVEGAALIRNGGVYGYNDKGEKQLKFAHDSSDPWANVQAVLFGQYATPEAEAYVDGGFKSLSADQTARYERMRGVGVGMDDAYALAPRAAKLSDEAFRMFETLVTDGVAANAAADIMDEYVAIKKDTANRNSPDEGVSTGSSGKSQMEKRFRDALLADDRLNAEQKKALDMAVLQSDGIVPDYTDEDSLYLSTAFKNDEDNREAARILREEYGLPVAQYAEYLAIEKNLGVDAKSEKHRQLATIIQNDKNLDEDGREALFRATILADNKTWAEGYAKKLHTDMTAEECAALAIQLEEIKEAYRSKDESKPHRVSDMADQAFAVLFAQSAEKEKEEKQKTSADKLTDTAFSKWLDEQEYSGELREKIMDAFSVDPIPYRWDMLTNEDEKKYAGALEDSGIDISVYLDCKDFSGEAKSDKDSSGKTISGSKKAKVLKYVREQCESENQVAAVMRALGYSYDSGSGAKKSTPQKPKKPKTLKNLKSLKGLI